MKAKHAIKKMYDLYKNTQSNDTEICIKVKDDDVGFLYLPLNPNDIKVVTSKKNHKVIVIDIT